MCSVSGPPLASASGGMRRISMTLTATDMSAMMPTAAKAAADPGSTKATAAQMCRRFRLLL